MTSLARRWGRRLLYPGFDVHTRARAACCRFWRTGPRRFLDAGCGNGYLSYLAWRSGATVDAVSFELDSIEKARQFHAGPVATGRLNFLCRNLYDLDYSAETFDEIICYETLEHLMRDQEMVCRFSRWLRPGGALHLCAPNKHDPHHAGAVPSRTEDGWHVRQGYDRESYSELLDRAGLQAVRFVGVGGAVVGLCDDVVRAVRNSAGDLAAAPLFLLTWPLWPWFRLTTPEAGFSIYVEAVKRGGR